MHRGNYLIIILIIIMPRVNYLIIILIIIIIIIMPRGIYWLHLSTISYNVMVNNILLCTPHTVR